MQLAGVAGFIENLVSFAGSQPLVPQVNGQAGQRAQFGGKGLSFSGLGADAAGQIQRIAHHDARDAKAAAEAGKRAQVFALIALALQRQNRLRRQAQLVRDGYADAAVADVEGEIARMRGSLQRLAPASSLMAVSDPELKSMKKEGVPPPILWTQNPCFLGVTRRVALQNIENKEVPCKIFLVKELRDVSASAGNLRLKGGALVASQFHRK